MSVSQEWNATARLTVRCRNRLWLSEKDDDFSSFYYLCTIHYKSIEAKGMMEPMLQSLSQMQCLTELQAFTLPEDMQRRFMNPIILKNSSTLREAFVFELPVQNGILYPQLILLNCISFTQEAATVCSRLTRLELRHENSILRDVRILDFLSSERMKSLMLTFNTKLISGGTFALVEKLQEFKHLDELYIDELDPDPDDWEWEFHTPPLLKLFSSYTDLEQLYLKSNVWIMVSMDSYVEVLVNQNPRLQCLQIDLERTTMTDASLTSLSRLTDLDTLALGRQDRADFTTLGILTLLRGLSRSELQFGEINHSQPLDMAAIKAELQLISSETGRVPFRVEDALTAEYRRGGIIRWRLSGSVNRFGHD